MIIAVTYGDGEIFQHFGHCETFKIYEEREGKIINQQIVRSTEGGHSALAGFLNANKVDVLICGGIGGGAKLALNQLGIKLYGGVVGDADEAVEMFLKGNLSYNPDVKCSHHDSHHGENEPCHGADGCKHNCH